MTVDQTRPAGSGRIWPDAEPWDRTGELGIPTALSELQYRIRGLLGLDSTW